MDIPRLLELVEGEVTPLIRTTFADDAGWEALVAAVLAGDDIVGDGEPYTPNVEPISDPAYDGVTAAQLATAWPDTGYGQLALVDETSLDAADPTVVWVDLGDEPGRTFRCTVAEFAGIEANLAISNMDFEEFADEVGPDGVFRGFTE